jgi:DNA-binding MarR family transcriptional regulator
VSEPTDAVSGPTDPASKATDAASGNAGADADARPPAADAPADANACSADADADADADAADAPGPPGPRAASADTDEAARLRAVIGRLSRRLRPTAAGAEAGLTPTRVSVLLHAVREGQARLAAVADAEGINPTMLSRIVSDLVEAGLLERVSDEHDRRAAWVKATPAGIRLAERMRRERTEAVTVALARLGEGERARILRALPALEMLADVLRERRA